MVEDNLLRGMHDAEDAFSSQLIIVKNTCRQPIFIWMLYLADGVLGVCCTQC